MSKKIRPPREIKHAVYEIVPKTKCEVIEVEPEPVPEPVDVTRYVLMESLFDAICQHSALQQSMVHKSDIVDMKIHVFNIPEESEPEAESFVSISTIPLSGLLTFQENAVCLVHDDQFFSLKPVQEPPLLNMMKDIHSTSCIDSYSIPRPLSMVNTYELNIPKLFECFHSLKSVSRESNYDANYMISRLTLGNVTNIASMLSAVQYNPENNVRTARELDMMKYDVSSFDMVERVNEPLVYREHAREWIHPIRNVDIRKLGELFRRMYSEYSDSNTREMLMELYPICDEIMPMLHHINEQIQTEDSTPEMSMFSMTSSVQLLNMISVLQEYEYEKPAHSAEPTFGFGRYSSTERINGVVNLIRDSLPIVYSESEQTLPVNLIDKMSVLPFPIALPDKSYIAEFVSPSIPFKPMSIVYDLHKPITYQPTESHTYDLSKSYRYNAETFMNQPIQPITPIESDPIEYIPVREKKTTENARIILSLTTTEIRVSRFLEMVEYVEEISGVYRVIINICKEYKRMGKCLTEDDIELIKANKVIQELNAEYSCEKYIVRVTEDFGPITKMTGGMEYMTDTKSVFYKLIVIDDDTIYSDDCLSLLGSLKTPNTIVSGSGFLFYDSLEYTMANHLCPNVSVDVVEGFAGICFDYSDMNKRLLQFIRYYRTIDWTGSDESEVNIFLKACFMGDDFIISYFYHKESYRLRKINGLLGSVHQSDFGFMEDALHRNKEFTSNMGTYIYIYRNIDILNTFLRKIEVCRRIVY